MNDIAFTTTNPIVISRLLLLLLLFTAAAAAAAADDDDVRVNSIDEMIIRNDGSSSSNNNNNSVKGKICSITTQSNYLGIFEIHSLVKNSIAVFHSGVGTVPNNERKLPYYVCYTTTGGWLVGWLLLYLRFFVGGGEYQPTSQTSTAIKTSRIFADVTANYSFPSFRCCVYVQSAKGKLLHVDWYNPTFLILLLITGMSHTHHIVSEKIEGFHHQENCCYQSSCC